MSSQEIVSTTDFGEKEDDNNIEESNGVNESTVRIRDVQEINSTFDSDNPSETSDDQLNKAKRKLPSWLASGCANEQGEPSKRVKADDIVNNLADSSDQQQCIGEGNSSINESNGNHAETSADDESREAKSIEIKIKANPDQNTVSNQNQNQNQNSCSSSLVDVKPAVVKQEATSSGRESCKFGITCYRRNPVHRAEQAHPGDRDYRRPDYPLPPLGTPDCPFGDQCYRRNPTHFQQFSHPPSTDFKKNWQNRKMQLRQRGQKTKKKDDDFIVDDDEESDEDPFGSDSDDDYVPSDESDMSLSGK